MGERFWYIKRCRLFERLTTEQLAGLEARARLRKFPKNTPVYLSSDDSRGVFVLVEGRVKLCSITPDGKEAILAFIEPGEIFGELALVEAGEREEHAETIAPSTVVVLPGEDVLRLMAESPHLSLGITRLFGLRRKRIERRLKSLLFHSNRERLVHLLLELAEEYGKRDPQGFLIDQKLSHEDLARIIGCTRERVTVLLGELQLEGLLKVSRQRIVIRDLPRLARCAGGIFPAASEDGLPRPTRAGRMLWEGET